MMRCSRRKCCYRLQVVFAFLIYVKVWLR
jgi:hypothetical protein